MVTKRFARQFSMEEIMELEFDPRRAAVLAMDLQNDIVGAITNVEAVLDNTNNVLATARDKNIPVVYVTVSFTEGYPDAPVNSHPLYKLVSDNRMVLASETGAAIHADVQPNSGELVLNKTSVDPFTTTRLAQHLQILDVNTVIIMGVWTNFAVESTARTAADFGYRVIVVGDACGSNSDENHEFAMANILPMFATVMDTSDVCRDLMD
jgi:nicotinamidase-related amidase